MKIRSLLLASVVAWGTMPASGHAGIMKQTLPGTGQTNAGEAAPQQQEAQTESNDPVASEALEEIVVTAQRREQRLQDVPVAVTALSAEQIEARGIANVNDITRAAPSLTITENSNATGSSINLRGIGTFAYSISIEPSVAVVIDDVALLQQAQAFSGLNDIARLEVLRGPQATLFGKNASAGVINITTQAPTPTLTGSVGAVATTDEQYRVEGMISGPLAENIGFRINAFYDDREGYIRNLNTGNKLNGERGQGVRARVDIDPTDALNIQLTGSYSDTKANGQVRTLASVNPGATIFGAPIALSAAGMELGEDNYDVRLDTENETNSKQSMFTGRVSLDLGAASLISITAYQDWKFDFLEDFDTLGTPTLSNPAVPTSAPLPNGSIATAGFHARNFTQELRLVSNGSRKLDYLVALFYANGDTDRDYYRRPNQAAQWVADASTQTFAAFTQLTYNLSDSTHIDAGLRYNHEKIAANFQNITPGAAVPANNATCLITCSGKSTDDKVTYKLALRQDISADVMTYASYATGYKGQGYDISTGFNPGRAANPIRPETSQAYEIGLKSRLFSNRVQLNVTGFWTDFKNFQAQGIITLPDGSTQPQLSNVGSLRSRGVEAEISARATRLLRIDASAAYTDAVIREFSNAPCYTAQTVAQGCVRVGATGVQNLSGVRLANAPEFKGNIAVTQDIELPSLPFDAFVNGEFAYQSRVRFDLLNSPASYQDAYGVFNGSIGVNGRGDRGYRVALFVNNLFDQEYATSRQLVGNSNGQAVSQLLPRNSRRYFGIRMRAGF